MTIREYNASDCAAILQLFYDTVHSVCKKDYTQPQLDAWATGKVREEEWNQSFLKHNTLVAEEGGVIVGFGDMDDTGYLDRLYVHQDYQGKGVASLICDELEQNVKADRIVTHASITAKPFFEKRGYVPEKRQQVYRNGQELINYVMVKTATKI